MAIRAFTTPYFGLALPQPSYHDVYDEYFNVPVIHNRPNSAFRIPLDLSRELNASGHSDSYAVAQRLCLDLLEKMPTSTLSCADQVRRMILASPPGSISMGDVAGAMYITRRTLNRRLSRPFC